MSYAAPAILHLLTQSFDFVQVLTTVIFLFRQEEPAPQEGV